MSEAITMPTNATTTPAPDRLAVVGALAWRFLRRSTHSVLPLLGILWGVPTFLYLMVLLVDAESVRHFAAEDPSIKRLYFLMTMITVPALPLTELIKIRSLYTLPLATRRIVNIQLGLGLLVIILVQLATVVYYKVVFEDPVPVFGSEPIPIFGPLLFLIPTGLIFAGLAAFLVDARLWKVPVAIAILGFFLAQGVGRFEEAAWIHSSDKWFTPSPTELLVLLQSAFLGYLAIRHAADRDRRGDTRPWADVKELWHRLVAWLDSRRMSQAAVARESLFPSASAAHRSYEWQTRGLVVPIMAALGGLLSLIGAWFHPADWVQGYILAIPGLLFFGMALSGFFAGLMHVGRSTSTMDVYRATRPLTDGRLATIALKNALRSTGVALVISLGYALVVTGYAYLCGEQPLHPWSEYRLESQSIFGADFLGYVVIILTATMQGWALLGFSLSCVATGRHWLYITLWFVVMGGFFVPIVLTNLLTEAQMEFLYWCAAMLLALTASAGTMACYRAAVARNLIPSTHYAIGGAMWLTATTFLLASFPGLLTHSAGSAAAIGLGALVALPLASAPMAVWWNRHR